MRSAVPLRADAVLKADVKISTTKSAREIFVATDRRAVSRYK